MRTAILAPALSPKFIVYDEFIALCPGCLEAAVLLSRLFWIDRRMENQPQKYPGRFGWSWQTWRDLLQIGLSRRGYEKARDFLLDLGVIDYRRGGFFGRMHWRLKIDKLAAACLGKNFTLPETGETLDKDGFRLSEIIPVQLWNDFITNIQNRKGKKVLSANQKKGFINQLKHFHQQNCRIDIILNDAIAGNWTYFKPEIIMARYSGRTATPKSALPNIKSNPASQAAQPPIPKNAYPPDEPPDDVPAMSREEALRTMQEALKNAVYNA